MVRGREGNVAAVQDGGDEPKEGGDGFGREADYRLVRGEMFSVRVLKSMTKKYKGMCNNHTIALENPPSQSP